MVSPSNSSEPAINENSCFLACIVSLLRERGILRTQGQLLADTNLQEAFPAWGTKPGVLTLNEGAVLAMGFLNGESYLVAHTKRKALEYWKRPERLGAFVITKKTMGENGLVDGLHAWRILECDDQKLLLMNPTQNIAETRHYKWNLLNLMKGRVVLIEGGSFQSLIQNAHQISTESISNPWECEPVTGS